MKRKFPLNQTCLAGSNPCSGKHPECFFFRIQAACKALLLSIFLLAGASLHAATIPSAATGNWSAGATWAGGGMYSKICSDRIELGFKQNHF
jgi:uncharacterized membrane protein